VLLLTRRRQLKTAVVVRLYKGNDLSGLSIAEEAINTKRQSVETLIKEWRHNTELQRNAKVCTDSVPRRIKATIAAKGGKC